jgi:hypothetical protein
MQRVEVYGEMVEKELTRMIEKPAARCQYYRGQAERGR